MTAKNAPHPSHSRVGVGRGLKRNVWDTGDVLFLDLVLVSWVIYFVKIKLCTFLCVYYNSIKVLKKQPPFPNAPLTEC